MRTAARISFVVGAALSIQGPEVAANITPLIQTRTINAAASALLPTDPVQGDSDAGFDFAPGFGLFNSEVAPDATVFAAPPLDLRFGQAIAKQTSSIGPTIISARGETSANLSLISGAISGGWSYAESQSYFDVVFSVDTQSNFLLTGFLDTQAITTGGAAVPSTDNSLSLWDVVNSVLIYDALTNDQAIAEAGILEPGFYRIIASAGLVAADESVVGVTRTVTGLSSFDLRLLVTPVPETSTVVSILGLGAVLGGTVLLRRRQSH